MHSPTGPGANLAEGGQEARPIGLVVEDGFAPIPAIKQVIAGAGEFYSRFTSHRARETSARR